MVANAWIYVCIAVGGGAGSVLRYAISRWTQGLAGPHFPAGTFIVNVSGALLLGFLATFLLERAGVSNAVRLGITVGFLGGYTTFSTFGLETLNLAQDDRLGMAALNVIASALAGLLAVWAGQQLARA